MAKSGPRQTPFTEAEWIERLGEVIPNGNGKGKNDRDWGPLFVEYIRSTPEQYKSMKAFCDAKGVPYKGMQDRGGTTLWNRARKSIQAQAMAVAVGKSVDVVAKKYEKQLRIVSKLEDALEHRIDRIRRDQASEGEEVNPFEAAVIEKLIDGIDKLAKTNVLLDADGVQKHELRSVNLHGSLMDAIKARDAQFKVDG